MSPKYNIGDLLIIKNDLFYISEIIENTIISNNYYYIFRSVVPVHKNENTYGPFRESFVNIRIATGAWDIKKVKK